MAASTERERMLVWSPSSTADFAVLAAFAKPFAA
jgi:hypothetical protein